MHLNIIATSCATFVMNSTNASNSTAYSTLIFAIPNPDQGPAESVVFTLCSLFLISVALLSNSFIVVSLLKKSPITASNHIIINLCFTDIVKCLLFFVTFNVSIWCGSWRLGTWLCKILPGLYFGCQYYSVAILSCLARQRYNAIAKPLTHNAKISKVYITLACNGMIYIGSYVAITATKFKVRVREGEAMCSHVAPRTESPFSNLIHASLIIQIFCGFLASHFEFLVYYVKIRRLLRANSKRFGENNAAATSQRIQRNKRATNTVLASVLAHDFITTPAVVFMVVGTVYADLPELSVLRDWGELWLLLYSCVNPILFIWRNGELKSAWKGFVQGMSSSSTGHWH